MKRAEAPLRIISKRRLIAGVRYEMQRVFVLKIMTHKQYDTEDWKNECHCF
jgi:mRNA-degrading endonuclease HigB of HigAB toxin-antitoxin module